MKRTISLILIIIFWGFKGFSQILILEKPVSINYSSAKIEDIIKTIGKKYDVSFYYKAEIFASVGPIAVKSLDEPLKIVLDKLLHETGIGFKLVGEKIVLYKKNLESLKEKLTIRGYIKDNETGEALIGATIRQKNTFVGTVTNVYGFYSITFPHNPESIELIVSYLGYGDSTFAVFPDGDRNINILLRPSKYSLQEIIISATRESSLPKITQMSLSKLTPEEVKALPSFMGQPDVIRTLQLMPGIKAGSDAASGLYVRGGGPDQNLVLLDGANVYNTSHSFNLFSVFNPDAIKSVEMIKGGFPARYGGRLSSVLDVRMKDGDMKKVHGEISLGYLAMKALVEGPIIKNKTSFLISGRRTFLDLLLWPLTRGTSSNNTFVKQRISFYDFNSKINHIFSNKDRLFLSLYSSGDGFTGSIKTKNSNDQISTTDKLDYQLKWINYTSTLRWNHVISDNLFTNTSLIYSKFKVQLGLNEEIENVRDKETTLYKYNKSFASSIEDFGIKLDFDYYPIASHEIKFGLNSTVHKYIPGVDHYLLNNSIAYTDTTYRTPTYISNEFGLYIEDDYSINQNLKINAGAHISALLVNNKFYKSFQPRVAARYLFNENFSLKASFSSMAQYIHLLSNNIVGVPLDLWVPVTDYIPPLRSHQFALGLTRALLDNKYELTLETYYKKMNNLIQYKEGANFWNMQKRWEEKIETNGTGESYGLEFFLQKKKGKTTGWVGYTLSWANRRFANINEGKTFPFKYDRRHDASIVISHKLNTKIDLSATWTFATGNALTFPLSTYQSADNGFAPSTPAINGGINYYAGRNTLRMPDYHRLDLGVNFNKQKKRGIRTWNISFYNVYMRKNAFFLYPGEDSNGNKIINQWSMLWFVPSFAYIFKF